MILSLLFIFFLLLENLFLPALIGPEPFFIVILFVSAMIVYGQNTKLRLIQALIFLLIAEIVSGVGYTSFILPFVIVALIYIWLNRFLEIGSSLYESRSFIGLLGGVLMLTLLVLGYSFLFLFFQSSYSIIDAYENFIILIKTSAYETIIWALFFVIIFKYVLRTK